MTGFEDRRDAFESKYAHDEKINFDVEARCSKLFGLWAADQLGLSGADAESYAKEVVMANLDEPGFDDIIRKVQGDFEQKGLEFSHHALHTQVEKALIEAQKQIREG